MKKLLLIAAGALLFAGCKKYSPSNTITGKWYLTSNNIQEYVNDQLSYQNKTTYNHQGYLMLNSDGSGDQDIVQGTTSDPNSNVVLDVSEVFTYTYSGNSIIFNFPEQTVGTDQFQASTVTATITTHTATTLEINITQQATENGSTLKLVQVEDFAR